MTRLMIDIEDGHEGELQKLLREASFKANIVTENTLSVAAEPQSAYEKLIQIQKEIGNKELFKDIDPVEWQREIRKEWDRDF